MRALVTLMMTVFILNSAFGLEIIGFNSFEALPVAAGKKSNINPCVSVIIPIGKKCIIDQNGSAKVVDDTQIDNQLLGNSILANNPCLKKGLKFGEKCILDKNGEWKIMNTLDEPIIPIRTSLNPCHKVLVPAHKKCIPHEDGSYELINENEPHENLKQDSCTYAYVPQGSCCVPLQEGGYKIVMEIPSCIEKYEDEGALRCMPALNKGSSRDIFAMDIKLEKEEEKVTFTEIKDSFSEAIKYFPVDRNLVDQISEEAAISLLNDPSYRLMYEENDNEDSCDISKRVFAIDTIHKRGKSKGDFLNTFGDELQNDGNTQRSLIRIIGHFLAKAANTPAGKRALRYYRPAQRHIKRVSKRLVKKMTRLYEQGKKYVELYEMAEFAKGDHGMPVKSEKISDEKEIMNLAYSKEFTVSYWDNRIVDLKDQKNNLAMTGDSNRVAEIDKKISAINAKKLKVLEELKLADQGSNTEIKDSVRQEVLKKTYKEIKENISELSPQERDKILESHSESISKDAAEIIGEKLQLKDEQIDDFPSFQIDPM